MVLLTDCNTLIYSNSFRKIIYVIGIVIIEILKNMDQMKFTNRDLRHLLQWQGHGHGAGC